MTSLTSPSHRDPRTDRPRPHRRAPRRRLPHPPQRPGHGRGAGPGLHRPGPRRRRRARRRSTATRSASGPRTRTGRTATASCSPSGTTPSPLYAAFAEAGIDPGRGARDLRLRRLAPADVGHGLLHPGHGDLRRVARPRARRRHGHGPRPAPPGQRRPASSTCSPTASSTRAPRGRPPCRAPTTGWTNLTRRRRRQRACRPTARPPACCASSPSRTSGAPSAGTPLRVDGNDVRGPRRRRSTSCARHRDRAVGPDLRHPPRPRRPAARDPREGALHAGRRARVADRPRPAPGRNTR